MKQIPLTQGKFAIVDDENFEWLNQWKWYFNSSLGYAVGQVDKKKMCMHRVILNVPKGMETDHKNLNKLDNRRCNLRICDRSENNMNHKTRKDSASGYKGVYLTKKDKRVKKWRSTIKIRDKRIFIGNFFSKEEAALAYNQKAKELFGEFARLNGV